MSDPENKPPEGLPQVRTDATHEQGRPGRKKGVPTVSVTVHLEPELSEWGKAQKGGLSALLRRLMRAEKQRRERNAARREVREQAKPKEGEA